MMRQLKEIRYCRIKGQVEFLVPEYRSANNDIIRGTARCTNAAACKEVRPVCVWWAYHTWGNNIKVNDGEDYTK